MAETQIPDGITVEQWDSDYFEDYINKNWTDMRPKSLRDKMQQAGLG